MSTDVLTVNHRSNEFRPSDWRWQVAKVISTSPPYPEWADEFVYYAVTLLRQVSSTSKDNVVLKSGHLGQAFQLYASIRQAAGINKIQGPALSAAELEGYILADISKEEISSQLGVSVKVIDWYEKLFFDVRDRLSNRAWITGTVIGGIYNHSVESLVPALAKAYGYYTKDPTLIRLLLRGVDADGTVTAASKGPLAALHYDTKVSLAIKADLATRLTEPSGKSFRSLVEMYNKQLEISQKVDASEDDAGQMKKAMEILMKEKATWTHQLPDDEASDNKSSDKD